MTEANSDNFDQAPPAESLSAEERSALMQEAAGLAAEGGDLEGIPYVEAGEDSVRVNFAEVYRHSLLESVGADPSSTVLGSESSKDNLRILNFVHKTAQGANLTETAVYSTDKDGSVANLVFSQFSFS